MNLIRRQSVLEATAWRTPLPLLTWNGIYAIVDGMYKWAQGSWPGFAMTRLESGYFILWMMVFLFNGRHTW